jgi:hypothetical protein
MPLNQQVIDLDDWDDQWDEQETDESSVDDCSTPDPNKYHDPATQSMTVDGGGTLASRIPRRGGMKGVIVPRSTNFGGSRGVDPHTPGIVNIDPRPNSPVLQLDLRTIDETMYLALDKQPITHLNN